MKKIAVISIMSYYARQIFDGSKEYEFRKTPLRKELLNTKIYVYSAKEDKAIIGYFKVDNILCGNVNEILKLTGYDKRNDGFEIVNYFGKDRSKCYALHLSDINKFNKKLSLSEMRRIKENVSMPQYIKYIYEDDPLYGYIVELK